MVSILFDIYAHQPSPSALIVERPHQPSSPDVFIMNRDDDSRDAEADLDESGGKLTLFASFKLYHRIPAMPHPDVDATQTRRFLHPNNINTLSVG
jgi:hypothetical protein